MTTAKIVSKATVKRLLRFLDVSATQSTKTYNYEKLKQTTTFTLPFWHG